MACTRLQLTEWRMRSAWPRSAISFATSAFVIQMKGLSTSTSIVSRAVRNLPRSYSTRGCVVRVARVPTTCDAIGRLKLTTPFSKKRMRFRPSMRATTIARDANKKVRVRWVVSGAPKPCLVTRTGTCRTLPGNRFVSSAASCLWRLDILGDDRWLTSATLRP
jgi:hypothetical protein